MEGNPRSLTVIPSILPSVQEEPHVVLDNPARAPSGAIQEASNDQLVTNTAPSGAIQEASNDQLVTNLIINYLPPELNEDELMAIFAEHGEIEHIKVVRDHQTRLSLGYGFVKYKKAEEAQRAVKMKNGFAVGTKRIKVSFSRLPKEGGMKRSKLFVTNLPLGFDEDCIRGLLGKVRIDLTPSSAFSFSSSSTRASPLAPHHPPTSTERLSTATHCATGRRKP